MKKSITLFAASILISGALFTSCNSPSEKVEDAEENVEDANKKLEEANRAYLDDIELYRLETAERIAANEKSIAEFNERIKNEKKEAKADYKKKIDELDAKNTDLKKTMDDYKANGKEGWEEFKISFSQSMDEVGEELKLIFAPGVK